jgi:hypothetical protein
MSGYVEGPRQCEALQDELAELALGLLSGRSRAELLDHVGSCPRCSAELERLSIVADTLLQLAPKSEPPLGFELRLAQRLQASASTHRPNRSRRLSALCAAAVVMVGLGFGLGALGTHRSGDSQANPAAANLTAANLTSHGQVLGEVMISTGRPAWMFMTVDADAWSGKVTCEVTLADGKVEVTGVFDLSGGYGAWGAPLTSPAGQVRSARLITAEGTVLASAKLSV